MQGNPAEYTAVNGQRKFANTTSSLYIESTISNPRIGKIIEAISTIINSQMQEDKDSENISRNSELYPFCEDKYIEEKPDEYDEKRIALLREMPSKETLCEFIKALYDCAHFSPECLIIC